MSIITFALLLVVTKVEFDVIAVPLSGEMRVGLNPAGRADLKREGNVTRIRIDIDKIGAASSLGAAFNTYIVWAVSPEGLFDNLGELDVNGNKAQFNATTRLTQLGVLISAEPHYMVDRPSSSVVYRSQAPKEDIRRRSGSAEVGAYDYSGLKSSAAAGLHTSVVQAHAAFQIAQASDAANLAPEDFRRAQVAVGAMDELVNRSAPLDILWATAHEAIRWSQRAAASARAKK